MLPLGNSRRTSRVLHLVFIPLIAVASRASAGPLIAPEPALTPAEEATKFHLPPGFEIQLVASEPEIQKPMNLNFDSRGRLWISHSYEYPFPAKNPEFARDAITVLEGIGPDGRPAKISRFADKLNIPIGVLPLYDGKEAIAWSIPHIWKLRDTDGDGVADQREIMFGSYDYVDTHGNQNALKLGMDGWVYANHGFRNDSKIRRHGDGEVVLHLNSGNTYRFRPDGSEIEQYSWGQVNPFGSCFDPFGNFFTADCHSKPISLVLRGGTIESFGKPHDGLGFTPAITGNDHGSTGVGGIAWYEAPHFPPEYRGNMFVCNVVTNRVHRDVPQWRGSTPWIESPEDFLTCDDFWFHPVDVQVGPDGALYIADFYNCIIGHYEVDINHPRRDRHRGRVWRIVWKGLDGKGAPPPPAADLTALKTADLFGKLSDPSLRVRTTATNELTQRPDFASELQKQLARPTDGPRRAVHLIWAGFRNGRVPDEEALRPAWPHAVVRANWLRAVAELADWSDQHAAKVRSLLADDDPQVRRIAAEALGLHPEFGNISFLIKLWDDAPARDEMLIHAVKIALRNQMRSEQIAGRLVELKLARPDAERLAEVALAVSNESAAWFAFETSRRNDAAPEVLERSLAHLARHAAPSMVNEAADFVQTTYRNDLRQQLTLFQAVYGGLTQRGSSIEPESPLGKWGTSLASAVLDPRERPAPSWSVHPLTNDSADRPFQNPWGVRNRNCADAAKDVLFFDSIVGGEQLTGILRSRPFVLPEKFSFWLCGHNGLPETNPEPINHVRLKLADTGEIVTREVPPRNDTARKVTWDLKRWAGRSGVLEVVDADSGPAFAWLGVSRFEPALVAQPSADYLVPELELTLAVRLVEQLKRTELLPRVVSLLADPHGGLGLRQAATQTVLRLNAKAGQAALEAIVANPLESAALRAQAGQALGTVNAPSARTALAAALAGAPSALEQALALSLAGSSEGADALLAAIADGKATPRLLQDPPVVERLKPRLNAERKQKIADLTANLAPPDQRIRQLVAQRLANHARSGAAAEKGVSLFKTHCAACHKIGDVGQKVGPQLDGIGQRGAERLLEDILDPNRNVDGAFRATIVVTKGGLTITGLKLRDEGQVLVIVDTQGKEQKIPSSEIDESAISSISPMPSNFAEVIPEKDFHHLLAFLLAQQTAPPAEPK
ncbi:MAG: c-type cytochrome [Planctomycetia bacterium]|nr:c-type cytochrome [Planctomycetia bacterium]